MIWEIQVFDFYVSQTTGRVKPHGDLASGSRSHDTFVLRVQQPDRFSTEQVETELQWLSALSRDTNLVVPEPISALDGSLVQEVSAACVSEVRQCVLFRWVEGCFTRRIRATQMHAVGSLQVKLHRHAREFVASDSPRQNRRVYGGDPDIWINGPPRRAASVFSEADLAVFAEVATYVCEGVPQVGEADGDFGLIHGDLYQWNYLYHAGEIRLIDFYDCGWGHYLHDFAGSLTDLIPRDQDEQLMLTDSFIRGYEEVQQVPPSYDKWMDTFLARRVLQRVKWILS